MKRRSSAVVGSLLAVTLLGPACGAESSHYDVYFDYTSGTTTGVVRNTHARLGCVVVPEVVR